MYGLFMVWLVLLLAAVGIGTFTAQRAAEAGRSRLRWGALSVAAAILGQAGGVAIFGWAWGVSDTSLSFLSVITGLLAFLAGPVACMAAVLLVLTRLPVRAPRMKGDRWPVYRMSTAEQPGQDCELLAQEGRLRVGEEIVIEAKDVTEIAVDGECLRVSWLGQSVVLRPAGKSLSPRERASRSRGLQKRLRALLDRSR